MNITLTQDEERNSNGWVQRAHIEMTLSVAADSTTDARARVAIKALDAAYRKVKRELTRLAGEAS